MLTPHLLMTEFLPPLIEPLSSRYQVHRLWEMDDTHAFLRETGPRIRAVVTGPKFSVDAELMDSLPNAELICKLGAGYDLVDTEAARARGIVVANTPGIPSPEVADYAMGLLIATVRRIPAAAAFLAEGHWSPDTFFGLTDSLRGRRIGIVGLGQIGSGIAQRCAGFDLEVSYFSRSRKPDVPYAYYTSALDLARHVDTLVIAVSGGPETRELISAEVIDALGPRGVIVNVARGSVIDQRALTDALTEGRLAGAGLDVFEGEPNRPDTLIALPNTVITPHVAATSLDTVLKMCEHLEGNVDGWFAGRGPLSPVPETPWAPAKA